MDSSLKTKYNSFLLPIELLIFFSIFDNFLALPFSVSLKIPYIMFTLYSAFIFKANFKYNSNFKYFFLFFVFLIVSSLWIDINMNVLFRIIFILSWIVLLICIQSLITRFRDCGLLIQNICTIGIINGLVGIIEFILFHAFDFKLPFPLISMVVETHPDLFARSFGFMFEPNWYGLLQIFFFIIYVFLYRNINFLGISVFVLSIIFTGNKITSLCLIPIIYYIFFSHEFYRAKSKRVISIVVLFFCAIGLYSFIQEILISRISESVMYLANNDSETITSEYDRFVYIKYLGLGFLENPLFGHGLNTSIIVHNLIPWLNKSIEDIPANATVQSGFFRLLYEQGLLGISIFIFVINKAYKNTINRVFFKWFLLIFFIHFIFYDIWNVLYSMPVFFLIILLNNKMTHNFGLNQFSFETR